MNKILLKDILPGIITNLEDIQLISAKTGRAITPVCYLACDEMKAIIDDEMDSEVFGIASAIAQDGEPYIRIMIIEDVFN